MKPFVLIVTMLIVTFLVSIFSAGVLELLSYMLWSPPSSSDLEYSIAGLGPSSSTVEKTQIKRTIEEKEAILETGEKLVSNKDDTYFQLNSHHLHPFKIENRVLFEVKPDNKKTINLRMVIYNYRGDSVRNLFKGELREGIYEVHWNGYDDAGISQPSGIYFLNFLTGNSSEYKKLLVLR